ncbi:DUF262 domain-containing protein [Natronolimnohabitans sp. A-GB9]|uniref:DUF262 domain-containing protein n=1 Tax=Natronolimnohabitans sp. A-GB9 TaxID=3069757 RepID=UPI0027B0A875|nr:DUF262 domain-containing protein [Natronolimnohabitans sp. A-GB9]MDQ2052904.1 DUF262 domain-containing protein [Natronolimnohabitans sp. A-GB9]
MAGRMNINADEKKIDRFLQRPRSRFNVPDYQRRYSWGEDQWEEFWSDLTSIVNTEQQHFLGSIVVIEREEQGMDLYELVDGQQRLATVSILLRVIEEAYEENDESGKAENVSANLRFSYNGEEYRRLALNKFDDSDYKHLLNGEWVLLEDRESKLIDAYDYFYEKIEEAEASEIDEIRSALLSSMSLVEITCEGELSAMRLFETLNNRGLDLSPVDLMKNHLIHIASEDENIDVETVKEYWTKILENLIAEISRLERFFQHHLMSSPIVDIEESISRNTLYRYFREALAEVREREDITVEEYVEDMVRKSNLYASIVNCNLDGSDISLYAPHIDEINAKLVDFEALSARSVRILLMRALYEYDNKEDIMATIRMIETFITRRRIVGKASGTDENKAFSKACSEAFLSSNPLEATKRILSAETPSDSEFRSAMANESFANSDKTKYILDMLERHHFAPSTGKGMNRYNVDIEHIAPRNITADKYTNWVRYLNIDGETFEREYCDRLGNLTLLEDSPNARAQDDPFEQKKAEYEKSAFEMTKELTALDSWSVDRIEERSTDLAEIAVSIWSYESAY